MGRIQNTKRNIIASYSLFALQMLFQFASRSVIVHYMGANYLGIGSLFTSILNVLNMAELGFSTTIIYNMYRPLAENDTHTVCALLRYYRTIYRRVCLVVLTIGLALVPFLRLIVKTELPADMNMYAMYALYLANTCLSYMMYAHKTALLHALQRLDIVKLISCVVYLCQYTLQFAVLILFHNYYLFLVVMVLGTVLSNVLNAVVSNKKYPQYQCEGEISAELRSDIHKRVSGLLICSISGVTYTSLDSIILSSFIGLGSVAIYSNYITIFNACASLITLIRHAMSASVGNSIAVESKEKNYRNMLLWQFMFSMIALLCAACMVCLYQPFMRLWMGEDMLLPMRDVLLLAGWLVTGVVQHAFYLYLSGNGLWNEMKWSYVFSTVFNLIMNIVLGRFMGVTGVILSSLLSVFISGSIWQCLILFRVYFKRSPRQYFLRQLLYTAVTALTCAVALFLCGAIGIEGIPGLLLRGVIACLAAAIVPTICFFRTGVFRDSVRFALQVFKRR